MLTEALLALWQVVAMRLPVPVVTVHLKAILDGILLWSADTKNQFKLKVGCFITYTSISQSINVLGATGTQQTRSSVQ